MKRLRACQSPNQQHACAGLSDAQPELLGQEAASAAGSEQSGAAAAPQQGPSAEEEDGCCYCWERPNTVLCVPCGHLCLCPVCAVKVCSVPLAESGLCLVPAGVKAQCPVCRQQVHKAVVISS